MVNLIVAALLSLLAKVATKSFFEKVVGVLVVLALTKLAAMTETNVDDDLVKEVARRLGQEVDDVG